MLFLSGVVLETRYRRNRNSERQRARGAALAEPSLRLAETLLRGDLAAGDVRLRFLRRLVDVDRVAALREVIERRFHDRFRLAVRDRRERVGRLGIEIAAGALVNVGRLLTRGAGQIDDDLRVGAVLGERSRARLARA